MRGRITALRGRILQLLKQNIAGLDRDGIVHVFYQYYKVSEIEEALHYLEGKGYLQAEEVKLKPYISYKVYRITPRGIDLLDGIETDKGVAVPQEEE
ncbi:MAG: hypothetical protein D6804_00765 [Aquificota bacterium]|jgi:hypothetical protein|nr:MAG: hypothetical protein D6804_00765 [Aquificota bacterium]